jgi:hypothetical protein
MSTRRPLYLTAVLLAANLGAASADPVPAPTGVLKDYDGRGFIQIEVPPSQKTVKAEDGSKVVDPGLTTWFVFRQAFVRPNRHLLQLGFQNQSQVNQVTLVDGNTERTWSPGAPYALERSYKNLEPDAEIPSTAVQLSMATYARVFRELDSGKLLPEENLEALKASHTTRLKELAALREKLATSKNLEEFNRSNAAAAEAARLRDDLDQLEIRKNNPCWVVEFPNKDLMEKLFSRGLLAGNTADLISKGKTTAWITKAEGLPIKVQTTANDGTPVLFIIFKMLKINSGTHPGELLLGLPSGTRVLTASADVREKGWEDRLEEELSKEVERFQDERRKKFQPPVRPSGNKRKPR